MPLYNYQCSECECEFDVHLSLEKYTPLWVCPECNAPSPRKISAPNVSILNNNQRIARQRNERAVYEPLKISRQHQCCHDSSMHRHGEQGKGSYVQIREGTRPWMLG